MTSSPPMWCPRCGHWLDSGIRGVYQCSPHVGCGLSTDTPVRSPRVEWVRDTVGPWSGWLAESDGYRLTVTRYGPGSWAWSLYRLRDDDPRWIVPGDPVARGRASEYRWGQRQAVGALAMALHRAQDTTLDPESSG